MNRVYQVVWNTSKGVLQAVSELRRRSAGGKSSAAGALPPIAAGTLLLFALPLHAALPTGGQVVGGQGSISSAGNTLTVNQNSQNLAINWQDFSIAEGHTVNFVQPNAQAAALNRITGNNVSDIRGAINANGRVFLVNPNGVMFSSTAKVDVGALVASSLDISTSDFMAGNYSFSGSSSNAIINQGNITVAAGGYVAMIAARIINTGTINTPQGSTLMGAGSKVTLDLGGPVKIEVQEALLATYIEQGGAIKADGGLVYLTAKAADELASSSINHTGITEARTLTSGADGRIMLMGDMEHGQLQVAGTLDASAPNGGDGGFIETSAAHVDITDDVFVTTKASSGRTGEWLIDPVDITIAATGGNVTGATIANALQSTDVTLDTNGSGSCSGTSCSGLSSGNGDIFLDDDIKVTGGNIDTTLTFRANRNIIVDENKEISSTSGKLNTVFWADVDNTDGGMIWIKNGSIINTNGGHLWMGGGSSGTTWNGLTVGDGRAIGNDVNSNGIVLIQTNLATNGGDMAFYGGGREGNYSSISTYSPDGSFANSNGIRLESGNTIDAASGTIHFDGYTNAVAAAGSANGIELSAFKADRISSSSDAGTAIFINGRADSNADSGNSWGFYSWLAQINSSGEGGIHIQGSGARNAGVTIANGTSIRSQSGNITLEGLGSGAANPYDILIEGSLSSESGDINLVADSLNISGTLASTGALDIRTRSAVRKINIGGNDVSALQLAGNYFSSSFADGFSRITIGDERSDTVTVGGDVVYRDNLILKSGKNILLNGAANMTGAVGQKASLTLWSRAGGNLEATDNRIGNVWLAEGSRVNTNGGNIVIGGGTDPLTGNAKGDITASAEGNAITRGASINGDLNAGGGDISIRGRGRTDLAGRGVSITGNIRTEGSGNVSIHGYASGSSDAVAVGDSAPSLSNKAGKIVAQDGTIHIAAQRDSGNNAINVNSGSSITSSGMLILDGLNGIGMVTAIGNNYLSADRLLVRNASTVTLNSSLNDINTISAHKVASLSYVNKDATRIGTLHWDGVDYQGIQASGMIDIATLSGNLAVAGNIATESGASNAVTLNAGRDLAAGNVAGGDIQISGATISTGTGGRATLYTGSLSDSTGMTELIGSKSGRFRYNSDEASTGYSTTLGSGLYAIYREQPTLLVSANSQSLIYGSLLPSYTAAYTGFANGDSSADLTGTAAWLLEAGVTSTSGNRVVGSYDVSYNGGLVNGLGYAIADNKSSAGTLTITQRGLDLELAGTSSRVYDGTTNMDFSGYMVSASGKISGDDFAIATDSLVGVVDKNVGSKKQVIFTGFGLSGSDAGNYKLVSGAAEGTASITQRAISISGISAADKFYDANTLATVDVSGASGWVSGDDFHLSATGAFADKHADTNKTVTLTSSYSGSDIANYLITDQASTTADINRLAITVSGITAEGRVYDGTTDASVSSANARGWLPGDDVRVSATGHFADKNAAANKVVNLTSSYSGNDVRNYLITSQDNAAASINSRRVAVVADRLEKNQGAADPALTYQTSCGVRASDCGLVRGESLAGELRRDPGEASGSYAIRQGTLNESFNPNYTIAFEEGHLLIAEPDIPAGGGERPASSSNQISQFIASIYSVGSRGNSAPAASLEYVDVGGAETALVSGGQQSGSGPLRLLVVDGGVRKSRDDIYPNQD